MRIAACTIIAKNYIAQARAWAESVRRFDPDAPLAVLVVDQLYGAGWTDEEEFAVVGAGEIGLPRFESFLFRYDVTEFSTAVKPWFLEYVLDRFGADAVIFFDPDILCFRPLAAFEPYLANADVILTPHLMAEPGARHAELERIVLLCGTFNLGFIALAASAPSRRFLAWWRERLEFDGIHDVGNGLFVDQKWLNLAVASELRVRVIQHRGANVAYWNLHQRRIVSDDEGGYRVDGEPLWFFHFSGYLPFASDQVSKYLDGFRLRDRPELRPLFADYTERLVRNGFFDASAVPYGLATFSDGTPISIVFRRLFRELERLEPDRWPYPRAVVNTSSFAIWALLEPAPESWSPLERFVWSSYVDLQSAFPQALDSPNAGSGALYRQWFRSGVMERLHIPGAWFHYVDTASAWPERDPRPRVLSPLRLAVSPTALTRLLAALHRDGRAMAARSTVELDAALERIAGEAPEDEKRSLLPWLASRPLSRVWSWFASRFDAHLAFRDLWHRDTLTRCLEWLSNEAGRLDGFGEEDLRLFESAFEADLDRATEWTRLHNIELRKDDGATSARGVNLIGHYDAPSGVGQAARSLLRSVRDAGIAAAVEALPTDRSGVTEHLGRHDALRHRVSIFNVNAENLLQGWPRHFAQQLAETVRIGVFFWELEVFPDAHRAAFDLIDRLWARSRFLESAFRRATSKPVSYLPISIPDPGPVAPARAALGLRSDETVFLAVADGASVLRRKNPFGAIDAFREAGFGFREARLVVKLANVDESTVRELYQRAGRANLLILTESLARADYLSLLASADAFVSLHRSEGLGLPVAEAMALGKPVIATGYGGTTDFTHPDESYVVPYSLERVGEDSGPYPADATWAEPDPSAALDAIRAVVRDRAAAADRGARGRARIARVHSEQRVAALVRDRLEEIFEEIRERENRGAAIAGVEVPRPSVSV